MIFSKVQLVWTIVFLACVLGLMSVVTYKVVTEPRNHKSSVYDFKDFDERIKRLEKMAH